MYSALRPSGGSSGSDAEHTTDHNRDDSAAEPCTVAEYLGTRLEQLGVSCLFGVPGEHLGPFVTTLREKTTVRWIGTATEGGAGQAAGAYARARTADAEPPLGDQGVGACAVPSGVGAFGLLDSIGGAHAECIPLIVVNAMPPYDHELTRNPVGPLVPQPPASSLDVFRQVTVDAQAISHPGLAPTRIDSALTACLTHRRPVCLDVTEDVWNAACPPPQGRLTRRERLLTGAGARMLDQAVEACATLVRTHGDPILWAGEELDRFRLSEDFVRLVDETGIPFCSTAGAKSVVSEHHPAFSGVHDGTAGDPAVRAVFAHAGCRIGLGSWTTSGSLGGAGFLGEDWAIAAHGGVRVGRSYFPEVRLGEFVSALRIRLVAEFGHGHFCRDPFTGAYEAGLDVPQTAADHLDPGWEPDPPFPELTHDSFFRHIGHFLAERTTWHGRDEPSSPFTVVADAGCALLGSMRLRMAGRGSFLARAGRTSTGYAVGAATGIALARGARGKRPMVFVDDASFQQTCQEMSTHVRHGLSPVVFVLDHEGFHDVPHPWQYDRLAEVFGTTKQPMTGEAVHGHEELAALLARVAEPADPVNHGPVLVRVVLDRQHRHDHSRTMRYETAANCPPPVGG